MIAQCCGVILDSEMNTAAPRSELCAESKEAQGARRQLAAVKTLESKPLNKECRLRLLCGALERSHHRYNYPGLVRAAAGSSVQSHLCNTQPAACSPIKALRKIRINRFATLK